MTSSRLAEKPDLMEITTYTLDSPIAFSRTTRKSGAIALEPMPLACFAPDACIEQPDFESFPDEVLVRVFSHLPGNAVLTKIQLVCKRFQALASDDYLWYLMVKRFVKAEEAERQQGRAKKEVKDEKDSASQGAVKSSENDAATPSSKEAVKKPKKNRTLSSLKPKDRDWKWVYQSKTTKFLQPCEDKVTGLGQYTWGGGSFYEGEWKEGKPHGKGIKFWEENEYYMGDWKEGKMDGEGVYHWPDGATYFGQWKEGFHDGEGYYVWEDGNEYRGSWKQGERDGYGVRTWVDGDVFKGDWVKGKRTGYGTYYWPNGSQFVGYWKNGSHHGFGTYTWLDGRRYTGEWEDSKKHGKGTYDFGDGCVFEGEWRTGHRHGSGVMVWNDGTKFLGSWVKDKRDTISGICVEADGTMRTGDFFGVKPYDSYFVEDEESWEHKYRADISRRRIQALSNLKALGNGKLPEPIREDKVLDPEG